MTAWQVAAFLACAALAATTQSITGFAQALILLGLAGLFHLAPLPDVANVAMLLSLASAFVAMRSGRRSLDREVVVATSAGSVFGVGAGVILLAWLSANVLVVLRLLLGVVIVACAIVVLVRKKPLAQRSSKRSFQGYGFLSGLLGGLFSASGPPLVYQFYRQPMDLDAVRDTLQLTLALGSLVRLLMVVPSGQFSLRALALAAMTLPLSMSIHWWMRRHPPSWRRETVMKFVCALLIVTGTGLIGPAVRALV
jgi:uncharacterized membrane protein YfcA